MSNRVCLLLWAAAGVLAASGGALAGDEIRLSTGEVLSNVTMVKRENGRVTFKHDLLGEVTLPEASFALVPKDPAARETFLKKNGTVAPMAPAAEPPKPAAPVEKPKDPPKPADPESFWDGWKGSIDLGLNGSAGNSENMSFRGGVALERKTELMETKAGFSYVYATDDGRATKSRAEAFVRNDWLFKDSPWGLFAMGKIEFDDFQSWMYRASAYAGPSYTFIKNDTMLLRGRVGAGISREFLRNAENAIIPEGLIGGDFEYKLNDRAKMFANVDVLPSLKRFTDYRIDAKTGLEYMLDKESGMNLKIGANDRYKSNPGPGSKRNDVEYFLTIGWNF